MLKDRFGHEVFVGCTVAYPGRVGSSCCLRTGVVTAIVDEPSEFSPSGRRQRLKLDGGTWGSENAMIWNGWDKAPTPKPPPRKRTIGWSEDVIVLGA